MSTWKETIETNLHKQKNKVAEIGLIKETVDY